MTERDVYECHIEIGGQRMTEAQYHAARAPLLAGICSKAEREQLEAVYGGGWSGHSEDAAEWKASHDRT